MLFPYQSGIMLASNRGLQIPVTSYANNGGTGDRTALITVTATAPIDGFAGVLSNLVDGGFGANATDATSPITTATTGQYVRFQFPSKVYIDEAKIYYNIIFTGNGDWKWRASNDASSWVDVSVAFTWDVNTEVMSLSPPDPAGYLYYQMEITADHNMVNDWCLEFEFKIAPGAT